MTWQPIATAKKDGRLLLLLVAQDLDREVSNNPTEDELVFRTIGHNNFKHDGVDEWCFAGWSWSHDRFVQGCGTPTHWQDMPAGPVAVDVSEAGCVPIVTPGAVEGLPRIAVDGKFLPSGAPYRLEVPSVPVQALMTDAEAEAIARTVDPNSGGFFRSMLAKAAKLGAEHWQRKRAAS